MSKLMQACIFDVKEFALNDGPGIRVTIFFKGCPLSCIWCHNPEGLNKEPEINLKTKRMVGKYFSTEELAELIKKNQQVFDMSNGGVTFSGGEPLLYSDFIIEISRMLPQIHKTIETSGYCSSIKFKEVIENIDLVLFDIKLVDELEAKKYTDVNNDLIKKNLQILSESNKKYIIRIPLIPGIIDTSSNLVLAKELLLTLKRKPEKVELLSYNVMAGAKYEVYNKTFRYKVVEPNKEAVKIFINSLKENNFIVEKY